MLDPVNFSVIETLRDGGKIEVRAQRPQDLTHAALFALAHENGKAAIVGAGRYVVVEPGAAEVAFGVIDEEYQGQGIGGALIRNLSSIARQAGLNKLIAEVLASNGAMLKVFERSGLQMKTTREGNVVHVTLTYA